MISYLRGKILNKDNGYIILAVNDIGYKIFINPVIYAGLDIGQLLELYTHQHVREDSLDLYGFKNMTELEMFELLLSISGIGPKSALGVLAIADVNQVKESITRGDPSLLTKVSGIGRKTAERVVLELREKITRLVGGASIKSDSGVMASGDEIDALIALGYSMQQAREALSQVDSKIKDSGERIKEALRKLGK
ncbi:MAG: Holliday junction branch migration protein RuvA [Patescibacteria group bacterium]